MTKLFTTLTSFDVTLITKARDRVARVVRKTPLQLHSGLSKQYGAKVYLKREDQQMTRSYKLRGAYNRMAQLTDEERKSGVVCASAGNFAQGVAYSCFSLGIPGTIFMPENTPHQKIDRVKDLGDGAVRIVLVGKAYDDAAAAARVHAQEKGAVQVHPFNDPLVIAGQGTIGAEIGEELGTSIDHVLVPIGGGGLASGIGAFMRSTVPHVHVHGVEPTGAASMQAAFEAGKPVTLNELDAFVDGVAVRTVGDLTYAICKEVLDDVLVVPEGTVCEMMVELYQKDGIVTEPAGALSVSSLAQLDALERSRGTSDGIKGQTIVCIVSGGNNDITRYTEVLKRCHSYCEK